MAERNALVRYIVWWLTPGEVDRTKAALDEERIKFTPGFARLFETAVAESMGNAIQAGSRGRVVGETPFGGLEVAWSSDGEETLLEEHCRRATGILMKAQAAHFTVDLPGVLTDLDVRRYRPGR